MNSFAAGVPPIVRLRGQKRCLFLLCLRRQTLGRRLIAKEFIPSFLCVVLFLLIAPCCLSQTRPPTPTTEPVAPVASGVRPAPQTQPAASASQHQIPNTEYPTPELPPQALDYIRAGRILHLFSIGWRLFGLWLILRSGLSAHIRDGVLRVFRRSQKNEPALPSAPSFLAVAAFYGLYSIGSLVWMLPLGLTYLGLEHRYGFSRQTLPSFLLDDVKGYGFGMMMALPLWGGLKLYARTGQRWWRWMWAITIPLMFASIVISPVVIDPAFNKFTPLAPGALRDQILTLAGKAGIQGSNVFVQDTSRRTRHVNAYVTGLGPTTRIVLNDTALQELPPDQILAMVGHEMGHYVEGHIWIGFASGTVGVGLFLWVMSRLLPPFLARKGVVWHLRGPLDLAALPVMLLVINLFLLIQAPIANGISRTLEHRADIFGLRVTGLHEPMARLFAGFVTRDYSDPNPPVLYQFWFGSHPALSERIAFARQSASASTSTSSDSYDKKSAADQGQKRKPNE